MKKGIYLISTMVLALFAGGCEDSFLDTKPSEQLSSEQIAEAAEDDPDVLAGFISGLYATMYRTGTGGTDLNHDDFGQKGYDIYSDMLVSDMVLGATNYGWYSNVARYQSTINSASIDAYKPWRYYYLIIFGANSLIEILGGNDAEQENSELAYIMGQAKAMRAYAYFYLAQFYSTGYGDGTERILPIYTDTQVPAQPLSTSGDVYNLIVSDLTDAIDLLEGFNRTAKNQVNQNVAKGLLAYALAARGTTEDLNQVVAITGDLINSGDFSLMLENDLVAKVDTIIEIVEDEEVERYVLLNPESGFHNVDNPSWMWGVDLTLDNELDLVSWWGQVDLFTYSYAWAGDPKLIDEGLYNSIPVEDIRKNQFVEGLDLMPLNKFYAPDRVIGGQRYIITDYVYMRLEEMYLLNAEANARLGQDGLAQDILKTLLEIRLPDVSYLDGLNSQALLDEIYLQTRIEMWGEGKAYLAMKRLKKDVKRGPNHLFFDGETFQYDADELTFPIPQAEVLNNPVLNQ